jgi:hypothetical protein
MLSTTQSYVTYQGNGATTSFPFGFIVQSAAQLVVSITNNNVSPAVTTVLSSSQYSVSGIGNSNEFTTGAGTGGIVTYPTGGSPLPAGWSVTIQRIVPYQQNTSLTNQGAFYPQVVEGALDYLTMEVQQLAAGSSVTGLAASALFLPIAQFQNSLSGAVASIGTSAQVVLVVNQEIYLSGAVTVPENILLWIMNGGEVNLAGNNLTINGPFMAGLYQVFSGTGTVSFGAGAVKEVLPQWWGAPNGVDDTAALQAAAYSVSGQRGVELIFPAAANPYIVNASGLSNPGITFRGKGGIIQFKSGMVTGFTSTNYNINIVNNSGGTDNTFWDYARFIDLEINGNLQGQTNLAPAVPFTGLWWMVATSSVCDCLVAGGANVEVRNCYIHDSPRNGIVFSSAGRGIVDGNTIVNCPYDEAIYVNDSYASLTMLESSVTNNKIWNSNGGIAVKRYTTGFLVEGNQIYNCGFGIDAEDSGNGENPNRISIVNNQVRYCGQGSWTSGAGTWSSWGSPGYGIYIQAGRNIAVEGNLIYDMYGSGIAGSGVSYCQVIGNNIAGGPSGDAGPSQHGIYCISRIETLAGSVTGSIVAGSNVLTLTNSSMAQYLYVGQGIIVAGAGPGGSNMGNTVSSISGATVTLQSNAGTTVTTATVSGLNKNFSSNIIADNIINGVAQDGTYIANNTGDTSNGYNKIKGNIVQAGVDALRVDSAFNSSEIFDNTLNGGSHDLNYNITGVRSLNLVAQNTLVNGTVTGAATAATATFIANQQDRLRSVLNAIPSSSNSLGTWNVGDIVENSAPTATGALCWVCTTAGTMGTLNSGNTTGSITTGTAALTVNSTSGLMAGDYITVAGAGASGGNLAAQITAINGAVVTLGTNAGTTVSGAAVSYTAATFTGVTIP